MKDYKVIFHIDELDKWNLLLANVSNLLEAISDNKVNIEVLANSKAVEYYRKNNKDTKIDEMELLNNKGVKFLACNNSLRGFSLKPDELINFIDIVPVGVLELVNKQMEGYAYLKP